MNGFKLYFSKIFWGGAHRAPTSHFFSGFALGLSFALNSQALRDLDSDFALDSRARPRFVGGLRPQLSIEELGLPPKKS